MSARSVALERLVVVEALDELEVGVEPLARGDDVLACPCGGATDGAWTISGRARSDGGAGWIAREVDAGRDHLGLGHPADRVVAADDLRVRPSSRSASCSGVLPRMSEPR